jgi:hypothetical protein
MQPTDTPTRYDVLSEPHPDNPDIGLYRAVAFHPDGSIDVLRRVRWLGKDAPGTEYPTVDSAAVPNDRFAHYLIREMELGDCEG